MTLATRLAPYASMPGRSRGRLFPEPESPTRTVFQRDRDRVIHSTAFRRLQYKTQVFVYHEGDHYRTRLTHSLEVSQIARSICRRLGLDEDLAEALALAHDLGHTPFGHAGEDALAEVMRPHGGFDHNAHGLRLLTALERRYAGFDGLNLTWETLEGLAKHNGPLDANAPDAITAYAARHDLELHTWPGPEAQVAALADDIAYNSHDLDDGLRAGLFDAADLIDVPLVGPILREVSRDHPGLERMRLANEIVRRLIALMIDDLLAETRARLAAAAPSNVEAVRALGRPVVAHGADLGREAGTLKSFLFERMYRHERVKRMTEHAHEVVKELFSRYLSEPGLLPAEWGAAIDGAADPTAVARLVADYIAGMTDRYALDEHARICGVQR
jgi:dGTPase